MPGFEPTTSATWHFLSTQLYGYFSLSLNFTTYLSIFLFFSILVPSQTYLWKQTLEKVWGTEFESGMTIQRFVVPKELACLLRDKIVRLKFGGRPKGRGSGGERGGVDVIENFRGCHAGIMHSDWLKLVMWFFQPISELCMFFKWTNPGLFLFIFILFTHEFYR